MVPTTILEELMTPYQKIMHAAGKGRGLRLTVRETWELAQDNAIQEAADNDAACPDCGSTCERSRRKPANRCCACINRLYNQHPDYPYQCEVCR